jgi:adenosylcobinamide-phosphate synthase
MKRGALVVAAVLLDAAFGDPPSLPHPVRAIGAAIAAGERYARRAFPATPAGELRGGAALTLTVVAGTYLSAGVASVVPPLEVLAAASALAIRDLRDHVRAVSTALNVGDLQVARERLARIVGRDTGRLDEGGIARAAIETLAESTCDGIVAPLFYLVVGGAPLALAYKAVNTLDSTIGHLEEPYRNFGTFAARLDDAANYLPARLAAGCIASAAALLFRSGGSSCETWLREGGRHRSPNAGQVEAAMSGALEVHLGGTNRYDGVETPGAEFGERWRDPDARDVERAMQLTLLASGVACALALVLAMAIDARA